MEDMKKTERFVIAVYVENKYGVLTRVTSMFTRRGFNIDSLSVGETERPEYSRITITLRGGEGAKEQIINQLRKLVNVKKVEALDDDAVKRELMLIKVKYDSNTRADIISAADVYRAKVIDYTPDAMSIEVTGEPTKIAAFIKLMLPFGIVEMCRTGLASLDRGAVNLFDKNN